MSGVRHSNALLQAHKTPAAILALFRVSVDVFRNGDTRISSTALVYFRKEDEFKKALNKQGRIHDKFVRIEAWVKKPDSITNKDKPEAKASWPSTDREELRSAILEGRLIHILPAHDALDAKPGSKFRLDDEEAEVTNRSEVQEQRHKELKASASTGHNWNTLFVRPDAVATYLAAKFNLTKEQVLTPSDHGSVAVRLAHAEAQLVSEMRDFLEQRGIDLDAFQQDSGTPAGSGGRRDRLEVKANATHRQLSGSAFLIKNLPVGTTEVEVRELLSRHTRQLRSDQTEQGQEPPQMKHSRPKSVIVPPLGITAIVEYALPQQARLLYRTLAYEPYKDGILYLQWLPHGALRSLNDPDTGGKQTTSALKQENPATETSVQEEFELITSLATNDDTTTDGVNKKRRRSQTLSEDTSSDPLPEQPKQRNYLNKKARLKQIEEQKQNPPKEEEDVAQETEASQTKSDVVPEDVVKPPKPEPKQPDPTKPVILVRNVAFQATLKELTELFNPIGGLIKVRLPQKPAGGHRGFAFVEFASMDQAKLARKTLGRDTHFLGRRLRIDFAEI